MSLSTCSHCGAPYGLAPAGITPSADRCSYCGTARIEDAPRDSRIANAQRVVAHGIMTSCEARTLLAFPLSGSNVEATAIEAVRTATGWTLREAWR